MWKINQCHLYYFIVLYCYYTVLILYCIVIADFDYILLKDFYFKFAVKAKVRDAVDDTNDLFLNQRVSILAASIKYGLLFVGSSTGRKIINL